MKSAHTFAPELATTGFATVPPVLRSAYIEDLISALFLGQVPDERGSMVKTYALRNILVSNAAVQSLATRPDVMDLVRSIIGPRARAVKATFFDKTPGANWKVPPHQDVTIAVQKRINTPGFGPWTQKAGIQNVQPPVEILEQMLALRLHLDDCDENNGALKVWPGSHAQGRLKDQGISEWLSQHEPVTCPVLKGGVMLMRPLLIHASSPATNPRHRRVIHIEYAGCTLPNGLQWLDELTSAS